MIFPRRELRAWPQAAVAVHVLFIQTKRAGRILDINVIRIFDGPGDFRPIPTREARLQFVQQLRTNHHLVGNPQITVGGNGRIQHRGALNITALFIAAAFANDNVHIADTTERKITQIHRGIAEFVGMAVTQNQYLTAVGILRFQAKRHILRSLALFAVHQHAHLAKGLDGFGYTILHHPPLAWPLATDGSEALVFCFTQFDVHGFKLGRFDHGRNLGQFRLCATFQA